jgi:hypothetical protein
MGQQYGLQHTFLSPSVVPNLVAGQLRYVANLQFHSQRVLLLTPSPPYHGLRCGFPQLFYHLVLVPPVHCML